ncbi:uncharacterized protein LOC123523540 [Mercenaria mercenaria]|uniref:uncharacterized protein LOC123523540 n=1 Tax=Mercenaria mercenaria TaxID=6596 RepID=UPI00234E73DC|nr:uncharacterized protein LOC123523540 [Mercenaria mercenaria]
MKTFIVIIAVSMVCCVYAQTYGISSYVPYDNYDGIGNLAGSRRIIGSGRLTRGSLLGGTRRISRLPLIDSRRLARGRSTGGTLGLARLGRGRVHRPIGTRYIDTQDSYIPRRPTYPTTY